jgi:hypothetical protein
MVERPRTANASFLPTGGPLEPAPRSEDRGALCAEVHALVERAALFADGHALLHLAPLECAAVLLGVTPGALEQARAALESPLARAAALSIFARAAEGRVLTSPARQPAPAARAPGDPEALLLAAQGRPGGLALLASAAAESVAIAFGVHPHVVFSARALAAQRGLSPDPPPDP